MHCCKSKGSHLAGLWYNLFSVHSMFQQDCAGAEALSSNNCGCCLQPKFYNVPEWPGLRASTCVLACPMQAHAHDQLQTGALVRTTRISACVKCVRMEGMPTLSSSARRASSSTFVASNLPCQTTHRRAMAPAHGVARF